MPAERRTGLSIVVPSGARIAHPPLGGRTLPRPSSVPTERSMNPPAPAAPIVKPSRPDGRRLAPLRPRRQPHRNFQHGGRSESTENTEAQHLPHCRGGTHPPCSPCSPIFLRAEKISSAPRRPCPAGADDRGRRRHAATSHRRGMASLRQDPCTRAVGCRRGCFGGPRAGKTPCTRTVRRCCPQSHADARHDREDPMHLSAGQWRSVAQVPAAIAAGKTPCTRYGGCRRHRPRATYMPANRTPCTRTDHHRGAPAEPASQATERTPCTRTPGVLCRLLGMPLRCRPDRARSDRTPPHRTALPDATVRDSTPCTNSTPCTRRTRARRPCPKPRAQTVRPHAQRRRAFATPPRNPP